MGLEELLTKATEDDNEDDEVILKPKKPKRVCSQSQLDALKISRAKAVALRTKDADEKKLKKAIELIDSSKSLGKLKPKTEVIKKELKEVQKVVEKTNCDNSSEEETEEEIVIAKKSKTPKVVKSKVVEKPKKKKKIITIEISDSDSDSEDEPEPEPIKQKPLPSRTMITQQNKKSIIKVHKPIEQINYFCD